MPTVSVNTQFPGYEILSELGRGNARVLKARHTASGELVAIKQFALDTSADTLRRFQQESDIMTRIDHPNVVKVREVRLDATMPYVVMEFVEGGDLRSLLKQQGYLDLTTTIRLGLQMTEALRVIHHEHVVHRDIKPENILYRRLISGELHFLLTDFGIAKIRADETTRTRTGQSLLTYEYASPEQFDDPRNVGIAADYYALGAVLYESVSGRVPFALADEAGLATFMRQVLSARPLDATLPTGQPLPPSLTGLLRDLLVKNPAERLHNPDDVELLLEQARVEQLRANRPGFAESATTTVPFRADAVTHPAPVPTEPDYADEPAEALNAAGQSWWAILLALAVTAGALTFVWKTRQAKEPATNPAAAVVLDSTETGELDTTLTTRPNADEAAETEPAAEEPTRPEASFPPDSAGSEPIAVPPADSVSAPPDSTQ